jgi:hypothetical protein
MNVDMIWDNPPDKGKRTSKWSRVSDSLKANPGKWAKLHEADIARNAHGLAGRLRTKWGDDFEVIARSTGADSAGVWARYIGPTLDQKMAALSHTYHENAPTNVAEDVGIGEGGGSQL